MSAPSPTTHRVGRTLARRGWVVLGLVATVAAGTAVAIAAPSGTPAATPSPVGTIPPLPTGGAQDQAAVIAGAARVGAPKVIVDLPVQVQHVYAAYNVIFGPNTLTTDSAAYVLQAPGPDPVYGVFPDTRITVMGFGAFPVAATLHLTQLTDADGALVAINLHSVSTSDDNGNASGPSTVTGQVLARVSDVTVDGVAVDVGPNCAGSTPIDLVLNGYDSGRGLPTDYSAFGGGPLRGTFSIPSFTGCGTATQDLDPLLTGTVSGPDNELVLRQGPLGEWDPTSKNNCRISGTKKPCITPAPPTITPPTGG